MALLDHVAVCVLLLAACLTSVRATINCTSREDRGHAYQQCFNDQGLQAPDIFETYRTSDSDDLGEVPVEDMFIHYGHSFCTNHSTELKAAVRCSHQIDTDCADVLERSVMPSPDDLANTMDPICEHLENVEFTCIKGRREVTGDCVAQRASKELATITDINQLKCLFCIMVFSKGFTPDALADATKLLEMEGIDGINFVRSRLITAECLKKEYKPCGCTSSKVYSDLTMDVLMPNSCDQTTTRVVCSSTNPEEFVNDGLNGVTRQGVSLGLLTVSVGLLVAMLF